SEIARACVARVGWRGCVRSRAGVAGRALRHGRRRAEGRVLFVPALTEQHAKTPDQHDTEGNEIDEPRPPRRSPAHEAPCYGIWPKTRRKASYVGRPALESWIAKTTLMKAFAKAPSPCT